MIRGSAGDCWGMTRAFVPILALAIWIAGSADVSARQPLAAIVVDANTGAVLHAHAADKPRYPASLTKMMTIYLVFERLRDGRLKPGTMIAFSQRAANQQPSKLGLKAGARISVANAVRALVTKSANDVATAVAEHIAGSESAFAVLMTKKARQLGMRRTTFRNASGLPNKRQLTTARDMARLGLALQDHFPKRYRVFATRRFTYNSRSYKNHNRFLGRYAGTDGIKTGYTRASGFNITTNVRRGGRHVIGVVIGHRTARRRDKAMRRLLTASFPKAKTRRTRKRIGAPALVARPRLIRRPSVVRRKIVRKQIRPRPLAVPRAQPRLRPTFGEAPRVRPARGRNASTLSAQAGRLAGASRSSPASWRAQNGVRHSVSMKHARQATARRAPLPRGATTHQVQVGAFFSDREARAALSKVQARAAIILNGARPVSVKVAGTPRVIYRARFAGFNSRAAAETCSRLKSVQVDCFVARSK